MEDKKSVRLNVLVLGARALQELSHKKNPVAKELRRFRQQIVKNKTKYTRKRKHKHDPISNL